MVSENGCKTFNVGVTHFVRLSLLLGLTECRDLLSKDDEDTSYFKSKSAEDSLELLFAFCPVTMLTVSATSHECASRRVSVIKSLLSLN